MKACTQGLSSKDREEITSRPLHKETIYWSAVINHPVPIPTGSRVSVKAHTDRPDDELLLIVDGAVYGCLKRLIPTEPVRMSELELIDGEGT